VTGVAAQAEKAIDHDDSSQAGVKFALDISRQTFGVGISVKRGEKSLEMVRDHFIEYCTARITGARRW